jgi:hypothetical protein
MYNYDSAFVGAQAGQQIEELHRDADRRRLAHLALGIQPTDTPSERISRSWWGGSVPDPSPGNQARRHFDPRTPGGQ